MVIEVLSYVHSSYLLDVTATFLTPVEFSGSWLSGLNSTTWQTISIYLLPFIGAGRLEFLKTQHLAHFLVQRQWELQLILNCCYALQAPAPPQRMYFLNSCCPPPNLPLPS
jgi:hypothetical protein